MRPVDELIAGLPRWRRPGMRALLALGVRPRGMALLRHLTPADQAAAGLLALLRYDEPAVSRQLGWDPEAVTARGRALRRQEQRP